MRRVGPGRGGCIGSLVLLGLACLAAAASLVAVPAASAGDLSSASYRLRALEPSSVGPVRLAGPAPPAVSSGVALGRADALGPMGSASTLRSVWPGVWPIASGGLPHLDLDGDDRPSFLDEDDDGDGLLDTVETGTGVFVSPTDTGTSPVDPDSDGDGLSDGFEVANGFDPVDPDSPGAPPAVVPALAGVARGVLGLGLLAFGGRLAARRTRGTRARGRRGERREGNRHEERTQR